jgi:hypothetical protein
VVRSQAYKKEMNQQREDKRLLDDDDNICGVPNSILRNQSSLIIQLTQGSITTRDRMVVK